MKATGFDWSALQGKFISVRLFLHFKEDSRGLSHYRDHTALTHYMFKDVYIEIHITTYSHSMYVDI